MGWREAQKSRTKSCQKIGCNCARMLCCWMRRGHCLRKISWFDFVIFSLSLLATLFTILDVIAFLGALNSVHTQILPLLCAPLPAWKFEYQSKRNAEKRAQLAWQLFFSAKTKFFRSVQEEFEVVQVCLNVIIVTFSSDSGILPARKLLAAINNLGAGEKVAQWNKSDSLKATPDIYQFYLKANRGLPLLSLAWGYIVRRQRRRRLSEKTPRRFISNQ